MTTQQQMQRSELLTITNPQLQPKGDKFDAGKPRMSLIDPAFLLEMAAVLTFGAGKYGPHNWRGGIEMDRLLDAALRHVNSFNAGIDLDVETGKSHLLHAACCLMMAYKFVNTEFDNRYKDESLALII